MEQVFGIQELLNEIMGYIHADPHVLKSTSLINKRFYTYSVVHTFHSITLRLGRGISQSDVPRSGTMQSFYHLLQRSPHIGGLVQDLRIVGRLHDVPGAAEEPSDAHMSEVLDAFTSISSIELQHLGLLPSLSLRRYGTWEVLPPPLRDFMSTLFESANLGAVCFANLRNVPVQLLRLSPNIKTARMVWAVPVDQTFINDHDATTSTALTAHPQLDSFSYISRSLTSPPIAQLLEPSSPLDLANLKTFNAFVGINNTVQQRALWDFLHPVGPQIEHPGPRAREGEESNTTEIHP
ncbi:hypothetical protein BDZ94DRAFT_358113 [Collybia nuda]|uniref:Uncharacterized protein n=1 Tax=Collybia nuda TaxID=64659 RepID=A0A9P6CJS6_9AGAR|nr:hypothetical protein BDZ94DRAFT_358113 [Collybia nuda]